ncbi:hypothetical protein PRZ48_006681 [Zasmidium cellare]|uniref:Uncharacterized protein n=1 Tax=Zasmidium cellare TaxID=395010 RepID=A0ABR0EPX3_ZASCE|nr:hypothetical protein PRZ48_006681 [Zasmidium cellare]
MAMEGFDPDYIEREDAASITEIAGSRIDEFWILQETADAEKRDRYRQIIDAHWPTHWNTRLTDGNDILRKTGMDQMPRSGQISSTTLIKSLAVMAFWMPFRQALKHLRERIKQRKREEKKRSAKHCLPSDVKWVLLNRLEGVGEGMEWKDLAGDALGYHE